MPKSIFSVNIDLRNVGFSTAKDSLRERLLIVIAFHHDDVSLFNCWKTEEVTVNGLL
jgi:hypothetical protein